MPVSVSNRGVRTFFSWSKEANRHGDEMFSFHIIREGKAIWSNWKKKHKKRSWKCTETKLHKQHTEMKSEPWGEQRTTLPLKLISVTELEKSTNNQGNYISHGVGTNDIFQECRWRNRTVDMITVDTACGGSDKSKLRKAEKNSWKKPMSCVRPCFNTFPQT